jgi:type IV fimbrial biogenesis protein FimT
MQRSSTPPGTSPPNQSGFTLIELMVVVALVAILAMLATPSWTEIQTRAALRIAVNDFTASLELAKRRAPFLNTAVTVCPSSDGINCTDTPYELGWIVRTGPQANAANQVILQDVLPRQNFRLDTTNPANRRFTFLQNGRLASNFNGATLEACPADAGYASRTRMLTINRTGQITFSTPGACTI